MRVFDALLLGLFLAPSLPALADVSVGEVPIDNILPCVSVGQRIVFNAAAAQTNEPIEVGMTLTFVDSMDSDVRFIGVVSGSVRQNNHATGRWTAQLTEVAQ